MRGYQFDEQLQLVLHEYPESSLGSGLKQNKSFLNMLLQKGRANLYILNLLLHEFLIKNVP